MMTRRGDDVRPPPAPAVPYGAHPDQVANLHLPAGDPPWPAVVLLHGGFWRVGWDRTLMTPLAHDLASRGVVAWNVEYRRVGQEGGGWPGTLLDVAAAIDALADQEEVDAEQVVALGHSAGGHLALWAGARGRLAIGAPGAHPRVRVRAAVSLAGVADLAAGAREGLGAGACEDLVGGAPGAVPERYAVASPAALLPLGVPQLLVHGGLDDSVPPAQSRDHVAAARAAGDTAELVELSSADHFDVVDVAHEAWAAVVARLSALLA
jgi:acetyl esterase/lipase